MLVAILALCAIGVSTIFSATFDPTRGASHRYIIQLYAIVIGLAAVVFVLSIDYRAFTDTAHFIYIALLAVLVYVLVFGHEGMGARRWSPLGPWHLLAAEF